MSEPNSASPTIRSPRTGRRSSRASGGKALDEITLDAVVAGDVTLDDLRITRRRSGSRPRSRGPPAGRRWPQNFERAAELVDVPAGLHHADLRAAAPRARASPRTPLLEAATELRDNVRRRAHGGLRRGGGRGLRAARAVHVPVLMEHGMSWKTDYRSIYYVGAPEPDDPDLAPAQTALLVIDVQNTYLDPPRPGVPVARRAAPLRPLDAVSRAHARNRPPAHAGPSRPLPQEGHRVPVRAHRLPYQGRARPLAVTEDAGLEQPAPAQGRAALADRAGARAAGRRDRRHQDDRQRADRHQPPAASSPISASRPSSAAGSSPTSACPRRSAASPTRASTWSWSRTAAPPDRTSCTTRSSRSST